MDAVVQGVDPYVHTTLIDNLPELPGAVYTIIQDPGAVNVTVVDPRGLTAGTLPNGINTFDIPFSFVYRSATNPAVLLGNLSAGTYLVILTGVVAGNYELAVSSVAGKKASPEETATGAVSLGQSVGYRVTVFRGPQGVTPSIEPARVVNGDLNGDGVLNCLDLEVIRASFGKKKGESGFNAWADVNGDGVVNILDLAAEAKLMPAGTTCK
jgi:hypothetical protein